MADERKYKTRTKGPCTVCDRVRVYKTSDGRCGTCYAREVRHGERDRKFVPKGEGLIGKSATCETCGAVRRIASMKNGPMCEKCYRGDLNADNPECATEGCTSRTQNRASSYCIPCAARIRNSDNPECATEGCTNPTENQVTDLCVMCARKRRYANNPPCAYEGCTNRTENLSATFCMTHAGWIRYADNPECATEGCSKRTQSWSSECCGRCNRKRLLGQRRESGDLCRIRGCENPRLMADGLCHYHETQRGIAARFPDLDSPLAAHQAWAYHVKKRDGHGCQRCGSIDDLEAHHLDASASHPDQAFDLDNGITLCHTCHAAFHRWSPVPKGQETSAHFDQFTAEEPR